MEKKFNMLYNIGTIAEEMDLMYKKQTEQINHMASRGGMRESILKDVFRKLLPRKFEVGSGIITDVNGIQSSQQDIFIYDAMNSPVFMDMNPGSIVPVESIFATIEVKSNLTKAKLEEALSNIRSVKRLEKTVFKNSPFEYNHSNFIMSCVFAYTSTVAIETTAENLFDLCKEIPKEEQPSIICVLDQGLIINLSSDGSNQIEIRPSENTMLGLIKNSKEMNLYIYYLVLQHFLSSTVNYPPDLLRYAVASHALDNVQIQTSVGLMQEGALFGIGKGKLSKEDAEFFMKYHVPIFKLLTGTITEKEFKELGSTDEERAANGQYYIDLIAKIMNGAKQKQDS